MRKTVRFSLLAALFLWASVASAQTPDMPPRYDLLLKGGHVIDPKNKISGRRDVAIKDGRIAGVDSRPEHIREAVNAL